MFLDVSFFKNMGQRLDFREIPRIHSDCEREGVKERESGPSDIAGI